MQKNCNFTSIFNNFSNTLPTSTLSYHNFSSGILSNGSLIDKTLGIVYNLGIVELSVTIPETNIYDFLIEYLIPQDNKIFLIDINEKNTGVVYTIPVSNIKEINTFKTLTISFNLNKGVNTLKFYSMGLDFSPKMKSLSICFHCPKTINSTNSNTLPSLQTTTQCKEIDINSSVFNYDMCNATLASGARIDYNTKFLIGLGGISNGFSIIKVKIPKSQFYNLIFKYVSYTMYSTLKISINGINTASVYSFPKSDIINLFTIPLFFKNGTNEIKFYGDGINYGPNLNSITFNPLISSPSIYNIAYGNLINNAKVKSNTGFVYMIGGQNDGAALLDVTITEEGIYDLSITYLSGDFSRNIIIDINEIRSNTIYCLPKTPSWNIEDKKTFTLSLSLKIGINTLKFHGDGVNYSPNIKDFSLTKVSNYISNTSNIDLTTATLINNANIDPITKFVRGIGGPYNGAAILLINISISAPYNLSLTYISGDIDRRLKLTLNNIDLNSIYTLPKTKSWDISDALTFTLPITLNVGNNSLKFHGDGNNYAPYLGKVNITPSIKPSPSSSLPNTTPSLPNSTSSLPNISSPIFPITTIISTPLTGTLPTSITNTSNSHMILGGSAYIKGEFFEGIGGLGSGSITLSILVPYTGY
ncbi:MAG: hypothetical protein ACRC7R_04080, partial [Sarcina sp.]